MDIYNKIDTCLNNLNKDCHLYFIEKSRAEELTNHLSTDKPIIFIYPNYTSRINYTSGGILIETVNYTIDFLKADEHDNSDYNSNDYGQSTYGIVLEMQKLANSVFWNYFNTNYTPKTQDKNYNITPIIREHSNTLSGVRVTIELQDNDTFVCTY